MARGFPPKHPVKIRAPFASAVLDGGMSVPAARRALAAGDLPGWTGKYDLPASTADGYVRAERTRREELQLKRADPGTVQTELAAQVRLAVLELGRRARAINSKTPADDIRDLARAQREVMLTARACQTPGKTGQRDVNEPTTPTQDSTPDLVQRLASSEPKTAPQPG